MRGVNNGCVLTSSLSYVWHYLKYLDYAMQVWLLYYKMAFIMSVCGPGGVRGGMCLRRRSPAGVTVLLSFQDTTGTTRKTASGRWLGTQKIETRTTDWILAHYRGPTLVRGGDDIQDGKRP